MQENTKIKLIGYCTLAVAGLSSEAAQAQIVTSTPGGPPLLTIGAGQSATINFGNGVGSPFLFVGSTFFYTAPQASFVLQQGPNGFNQQFIGSNDPNRLPLGYLISSGRVFSSVAPVGNTFNDLAGASAGYFNNTASAVPVTGFVGFRFQSPALTPGFHYGFFDVLYDNFPDFTSGHLTVRAFAYELTTDAPITTFDVNAVPEPSSFLIGGLGMLACGAAGIRNLRARNKAQADASISAA